MKRSGLYNSIMEGIATDVKKSINEYGGYSARPHKGSGGIVNYDLYNFAIKVLEPLCEKYFKRAVWAKVTTRATQCKPGADTHRASFTATIKSLDNPKDPGEKVKVTCKIYNQDKQDDTIAIDFAAIMEGYYKLFASIIGDTVYYLDYSDVIKYQEQMGNACASRDGKFIYISADYFTNAAMYSAEMDAADIEVYNAGYKKYVAK